MIVLLITRLLPGAISTALPMGKYIGIIVTLLLQAVLFFGYHSFFLKLSKNQTADYKELYEKRTMI